MVHIKVVCSNCCYNNDEPVLEINFKDQTLYYICPQCKTENKIVLKIENKPYPKSKRLR